MARGVQRQHVAQARLGGDTQPRHGGEAAELWVQERVRLQTEPGDLARGAGHVGCRVGVAARRPLVVHQARPGRVDGAPARLVGAQAQRDVAVGDLVGLVEAADAVEHLAPDHLAGAHDGEPVARRVGRAEHSPGRLVAAIEHQAIEVDADGDAGVLQRAVRVAQLGADDADAGQPGDPHHLAEPAGLDHLDVVVEEQQ